MNGGPYRSSAADRPTTANRPSAPGEGITNLPYAQAIHVVQALSLLGLPAHDQMPVGVHEYVPLITPAWLSPILRKIDDTLINFVDYGARAPSVTARVLVLLLAEHGQDTFEATWSLAGPEAVINLLKKSVMRPLVERALNDLYREHLTLSRAVPEVDP